MRIENELSLKAANRMVDAMKELDSAKRLFKLAGNYDAATDCESIIGALDVFSQAIVNRIRQDHEQAA